MAGAGFRSWADEEPFYAADLMQYLMEQSVMVFASTATRDAALPVPTEGMVCYTKDDNVIRYFDGTLWNAIGELTAGSGVAVSESTSSFTISLDVDNKGDLLVGTANNTVAKVPVGANGRILKADSTQTAGVTWAQEFNYQYPLTLTTVTSTPYTLTSSNVGNVLWFQPNGSSYTLVLPADSSIPSGSQIMVFLQTTGSVNFSATSPSILYSKNGYASMTTQYAAVTLLLRRETVGGTEFFRWYAIGDLG